MFKVPELSFLIIPFTYLVYLKIAHTLLKIAHSLLEIAHSLLEIAYNLIIGYIVYYETYLFLYFFNPNSM